VEHELPVRRVDEQGVVQRSPIALVRTDREPQAVFARDLGEPVGGWPGDLDRLPDQAGKRGLRLAVGFSGQVAGQRLDGYAGMNVSGKTASVAPAREASAARAATLSSVP
jgi:hypothetical protein